MTEPTAQQVQPETKPANPAQEQQTPPTFKKRKSVPWVFVTGEPGMGKTTFSNSGTGGFALDNEDRAFIFGDMRKVFNVGRPRMFGEMASYVAEIGAKGKRTPNGIEFDGKLINYLTIDTFDTVQQVLVTSYLQQKSSTAVNYAADIIRAPSMEMRDWGVILNYQKPFLNSLLSLRIPIVFVAHTKETEPTYDNYGNVKRNGKIDFAIAGAIASSIMNLVTYGIYIYMDENGKYCFTGNRTIIQGSRVMTTKTGGNFKKPFYEYTLDANGRSTEKWIDNKILALHEWDPSAK